MASSIKMMTARSNLLVINLQVRERKISFWEKPLCVCVVFLLYSDRLTTLTAVTWHEGFFGYDLGFLQYSPTK